MTGSVVRILQALTAFLLMIAATSSAHSAFTISSSGKSLALHMRVLENTDDMSVQQASIAASQAEFNQLAKVGLSINQPGYWLYFEVNNDLPSPFSGVINLDYIFVEQAKLYQINSGTAQLLDSTSIQQSVLKNTLAYRSPSFPVSVAPQTQQAYLMFVKFSGKANHALEIEPKLLSIGQFFKLQLSVHLAFGLMVGILLAMTVYNALLFIKIGIQGYIYYSLYLACYILIIFAYEGFAFYLPVPPSTGLVKALMSLVPSLASLCLIAFGRHVLDLRRFSQRLDRFYAFSSVVIIIALPLTFLNLGWFNLALELGVVCLTVSIGIVAAFLPAKQFKAARLYAISFIFVAVGYGIETTLYSISTAQFFATPTGVRLVSLVEQYFMYSCALIEMFFLMLALSSHIDQLREDKRNAQQQNLEQLKTVARLQEEQAEELEKQVTQKTQQIESQRQQLEKQNVKLIEVDRLKSQFLANISHELLTPLTLIKGPIEQAMASRPLSQEAQQALSISQRNTERLLYLVEELLTLSKLESASLKLSVGAYDLKGFCQRLAAMFEHSAREKNINFTLALEDCQELAFFDAKKLESVVANLLSNAIKYSKKGGEVRFELGSNTSDENGTGSFFTLSIKDNGPGIPAEDQPHIFERFFRLERDHQGNAAGSGIGLAIVKELIDAHGGSVVLSSPNTGGSEFVLNLPSGFAHFQEREINVAKPESDQQAEDRLKTLHSNEQLFDGDIQSQPTRPSVLLVEDVEDMRQYVANVLASEFNVSLAENGKQALDLLQHEQFDVVISDIMMPEMDGIELLQQMKQSESLIQTPVILLTARNETEDRVSALKIGADDYLTKPFNTEELVLRIQRLCNAVQADSMQTIESAEYSLLAQARAFIEENIADSNYDVHALAKSFNMSKPTLHRRFSTLATTPAAFMREVRLAHAHKIITEKRFRTLSEVAFAVGFQSAGYFSRLYKQHYAVEQEI